MADNRGNAASSVEKSDNGALTRSGELSSSSESELSEDIYHGLVFHVGVNSVGRQFCHPRYLRIQGKLVEMFKKDPTVHRGQEPIRRGIAGQFLTVKELGRRRIDYEELYVLRIYSRVDYSRSGEIACLTAEEAQKWKAAFEHAKEEAELGIKSGSGHKLVDDTDEFKLDGHRRHVRRYAKGLTRLITIGKGPEWLLRREPKMARGKGLNIYAPKHEDDTVDQHEWRCVCTTNGIRILEDEAAYKAEKIVIMKSVGVVEATPSAVFEMIINVKDPQRKEWDILTGDLETVEIIHGHLDIVYGTFDPKFLRRWHSKRDFVFSRYWRNDPDGAYSIIQIATTHKGRPPKSGYRRIKINPSTWEIKPLTANGEGPSRSLVTQTVEIRSSGWGRKRYYAKFCKTTSFILLCQVAGLRDFFAANPDMGKEGSLTTVSKNLKKALGYTKEATDGPEAEEDFYDALTADVPEEEEEDSDEEEKTTKKVRSQRFRSIAWGLTLGISSKRHYVREELVANSSPVEIDISHFKGSLPHASTAKGSNCWSDPGGKGFMVRGKTYTEDYLKVPGGDPLLKLLAVDWLTCEQKMDFVAIRPSCLVQSEAGRKLPFILVVNLQVPSRPNYSLVFYFGADRPIKKESLLDRFANGDNAFRDSHFKLIPSIVEGYWVVKRAVGTKACLLGRAVTCDYHRQDNFLEIDVDIGSSSVARSIISLVLGYVTSIVVDLGILIEGKEEHDLPEYLLGTTRINRIRLDSALQL